MMNRLVALVSLCVAASACGPAGPTPPEPDPQASAPVAAPAAPDTMRPAATGPDTTRAAWTVGIVDLPGAGGDALVRSVRLASHPEAAPPYDRVVFEVEGGTPAVHAEYVDRPVRTCGSGEALYPEGDGYLEIRLTGARAHTEAGEPTVPHDRQGRDLPNLRETVPTCDFEGVVTWVLGLTSPEPFRVLRLDNPTRVVVDVQHLGQR